MFMILPEHGHEHIHVEEKRHAVEDLPFNISATNLRCRSVVLGGFEDPSFLDITPWNYLISFSAVVESRRIPRTFRLVAGTPPPAENARNYGFRTNDFSFRTLRETQHHQYSDGARADKADTGPAVVRASIFRAAAPA